MKQRILVVARANELRTSLVSALLSGGYAVEASDHAERARELAGAGEIALAILEAAALGELGAEFVGDWLGRRGVWMVTTRICEGATRGRLLDNVASSMA